MALIFADCIVAEAEPHRATAYCLSHMISDSLLKEPKRLSKVLLGHPHYLTNMEAQSLRVLRIYLREDPSCPISALAYEVLIALEKADVKEHPEAGTLDGIPPSEA